MGRGPQRPPPSHSPPFQHLPRMDADEDAALHCIDRLTRELARAQKAGSLADELRLCRRLGALHARLPGHGRAARQFARSCLQVAAALGDGSATNTLVFSGAGTLQANGNISSPATRNVTLNANATLNSNGNAVSIDGVIGGTGNHLMGRAIVGSARAAFGPAPVAFPAGLDVVAVAPRRRSNALTRATSSASTKGLTR